MTAILQHASRKHLKSRKRARGRAYHFLPQGIRQLSAGDIAEIQGEIELASAALKRELDAVWCDWTDPNNELRQKWECLFAVSVVLASGWRLANLFPLRLFQSPQILNAQKRREGFFLEGGQSFLQITPRRPEIEARHLRRMHKKIAKKIAAKEAQKGSQTASRPTSEKDRKKQVTAEKRTAWAKLRYLPSPVRKNDEVRLEVGLGERSNVLLAMRPAPGVSGDPIFLMSKVELWKAIEVWLGTRRLDHVPSPRRSARTVESLERYRRQQMIEKAGGDSVIAARATARFGNVAGGKYYGTSTHFGRDKDGKRLAIKLGAESRFATGALRQVVETLRERASKADPEFTDVAAYTAFLVSFGLGHRGSSDFLPGTLAIDHETGFCVIHDKYMNDVSRARLVWASRAVRQQISAYESAIDQRRVLDEPLSVVLAESVKHGRIQFPDPSDPSKVGTLEDVLVHAISSCEPAGEIPKNVGRHWFRTEMLGRCSSQSIDAFLGHWYQGSQPWAHGSGLDPLVYRADIERSLDRGLQQLGLTCAPQVAAVDEDAGEKERGTRSFAPWLLIDRERRLETHAKSTYCSIHYALGPGELVSHNVSKIRSRLSSRAPPLSAGRMLASAVLNGAFLQSCSLNQFLDGEFLFEGRLQWVDFARPSTDAWRVSKRARWCADQLTREQIILWRKAKSPRSHPTATEELTAYLEDEFCGALSLQQFFDLASSHWSIRLPALLFDQALGELPCTDMNAMSWKRTLGSQFRSANLSSWINSHGLETKSSYRKLLGTFREGHYWPECRIFELAEDRRRAGDATDAFSKKLCAEWIEARIEFLRRKKQKRFTSLGKNLLLRWCAARLGNGRGLDGKMGLKPTTMKRHLAAIVCEIFPGVAHREDFAFDRQSLEAAFRICIARTPYRRLVTQAYRDLDLYLEDPDRRPNERGKASVDDRYDPDLSDTSEPGYVSAHIVNEADFQSLLVELGKMRDGREMQLIAILGYRAGLRLWEILGLRLSDLLQGGGRLDLCVVHSVNRRLKTVQSERVLPLHVLLKADEQEALRTWVFRRSSLMSSILASENIFHQTEAVRKIAAKANRTGQQRTVDLTCTSNIFGEHFTRSIISITSIHEKFNTAFEEVYGFRGGCFGWLRHSFSSLLLVTLMLPDESALNPLPTALLQSLNWQDRPAFKREFLGAQQLSRSALQAVSQAMGHTAIGQTMLTYQHLLCVLLAMYVERDALSLKSASSKASENRERDTSPHGSEPYKLPNLGAIKHSDEASLRRRSHSRTVATVSAPEQFTGGLATPGRPSLPWPLVLLCANGVELPSKSLEEFGVSLSTARLWRKSSIGIYKSYFAQKNKDRLIAPRGAMELFEMNRIWNAYNEEKAQIFGKDKSAFSNFVRNYDGHHGRAILSSRQARAAKNFILRLGFRDENVVIEEEKKNEKPTGRALISIRSIQEEWTPFGYTEDRTRRATLKNSKRARRAPKRDNHNRPLNHSRKLLLLMIALAEGLKGEATPHGNCRRKRQSGALPA